MARFDVFISHDTVDYQLALKVHDILDKIGFNPYIYELYPQYRKTIPEGIRDAMKSCSACLVLLTFSSIQSIWVHQELGLAYGLPRIIIPVLQIGVEFEVKGFVEMVSHIDYDPNNPDNLAYSIIWALRNEVFGHNARPGLRLRCPNGHESRDYKLPSTDEINEILKVPQQAFTYNCTKCNIEILVSPYTFEEVL